RLAGRGRVEVAREEGAQALLAPHVILATGARARTLPGLEPDGEAIWTYKEAMVPEAIPGALLVVHSGALGVGVAGVFRAPAAGGGGGWGSRRGSSRGGTGRSPPPRAGPSSGAGSRSTPRRARGRCAGTATASRRRSCSATVSSRSGASSARSSRSASPATSR